MMTTWLYIHYHGEGEYVKIMFSKIDAYIMNKKSSQAKHQMKHRKVGAVSDRAQPDDTPDWAIRAQ